MTTGLNLKGISLLSFLYIDSMLIYDILVFCLDFCLCFGKLECLLYLVSLRYPYTIDDQINSLKSLLRMTVIDIPPIDYIINL